MTRSGRVGFLLFLLIASSARIASAHPPNVGRVAIQDRSGGNRQIHVTFKTVTATPGTTFQTPLYVTTAKDVRLRSVTVHVSYVKGAFSFAHAEKGFLLQSGVFEIDAAASPHATNNKLETVKITVKADPANPAAALPSGLLLYLRFSIPENTQPALITLQGEVVAAEPVGDTKLSKARWLAEPQTVTIGGPGLAPIIACFFYQH